MRINRRKDNSMVTTPDDKKEVICSICNKLGDSKTLHRDIVSGCERGMVCRSCLIILSMAGNSKKILEKIIYYLAEWEMKDDC